MAHESIPGQGGPGREQREWLGVNRLKVPPDTAAQLRELAKIEPRRPLSETDITYIAYRCRDDRPGGLREIYGLIVGEHGEHLVLEWLLQSQRNGPELIRSGAAHYQLERQGKILSEAYIINPGDDMGEEANRRVAIMYHEMLPQVHCPIEMPSARECLRAAALGSGDDGLFAHPVLEAGVRSILSSPPGEPPQTV